MIIIMPLWILGVIFFSITAFSIYLLVIAFDIIVLVLFIVSNISLIFIMFDPPEGAGGAFGFWLVTTWFFFFVRMFTWEVTADFSFLVRFGLSFLCTMALVWMYLGARFLIEKLVAKRKARIP